MGSSMSSATQPPSTTVPGAAKPASTIPVPPPVAESKSSTTGPTPPESERILAEPEEVGPGSYEDLHRKCKDVFPVPFDGGKLVINKALSQHFQICHNLTMSTCQPPGYKFGCTYIGTHQPSPSEAYPVLLGEIDPSGNLNANIIHQFSKALRCKFQAQIQNSKWVATQMTADVKGRDYVASLTFGNPDIINESGITVCQYLQNVTRRLAVGAECQYMCGPTLPGNQIAVYTLAGRYTADKWQVSGSLTPAMGGLHLCYLHKVHDTTQIGVELEGSLRSQECTATIGYQIDLPKSNVTFRGQFDSNWCVSAVMEKKLPPLPFTFALSAFANHTKGAYRFGIGLLFG